MGREARVDFVIGLGGGRLLEKNKAAALLIPNSNKSALDLWDANSLTGQKRLPVLAIPTTSGTGSEVTPFSIITTHKRQTKASLPHFLFPEKAFLNAEYTAHMPDSVTLHTAVDALSHLIEGYLSSRANMLSDSLAEGGLGVYSEDNGHLMSCMAKRQFDMSIRNKLLINSALAGMVITQARTTLPHQMGYFLTYNKKTPHGAACGILLAEYMRFHENKKKIDKILHLLGLSNVDEFKEWMSQILDLQLSVTPDEIITYARAVCSNAEKLKTHPFSVTSSDIHDMFTRSLT
jgi:alcohol dehydrogenase